MAGPGEEQDAGPTFQLYRGTISPSKPKVSRDDRQDYKASDRSLELHREGMDGRDTYAPRLFWLTITWLGTVLLLLVLSAFPINLWGRDFRLSDSVLITLIGSTTATVLGLFAIVTRFYFHHAPASKDE